jgi:hypothetical protein
MPKGKGIRRNVDLAFDVYCETGGDVAATIRELASRHGLTVSRPTFYDWAKAHSFDARRVGVDARRQADREALLTARARMVRGLLDRMEQYEAYMASQGGKPDHMAQFAYNGIVGQLRLLVRKFEYEDVEETAPAEDVKVKARDILKEIYGIE